MSHSLSLKKRVKDIRKTINLIEQKHKEQIALLNKMLIQIIIKETFPKELFTHKFLIINAWYYLKNYTDIRNDYRYIKGLKRTPLRDRDREELKNIWFFFAIKTEKFVEVPDLNLDFDFKVVKYK